MKKMRIWSVLLLMSCLVGSGLAWSADTLTFGIHPFKKPTKLFKMFKPVVAYLEQETGAKIKIVIGKSYDDILDKYNEGSVDFGYFGPSLYVTAHDRSGVLPLARITPKGKGTFQGVIVVQQDSPIESLADLKGKSFAFGDKASTLSHYVPHYMLMKTGVTSKDLSKFTFTGSHDNVALSVMKGKFDAGGLKPGVAKNYLTKGLRVLATSEPVSEHLFGASAKLDAGTRDKIKAALLKADASVLKPIKGSITGTEEVKNSDYDNLRQILDAVNEEDPV